MTIDVLEELHGAIAQTLLTKIRTGTASAAEISAAVKFLKDNGIDCYGKENEDVTSLADRMDFPVDVDNVVTLRG